MVVYKPVVGIDVDVRDVLIFFYLRIFFCRAAYLYTVCMFDDTWIDFKPDIP